MSTIDPHARVHPTAVIGEDCILEADCRIGPGVRLGAGCRVGSFAIIEGDEKGGADIGPGCVIGTHAFLGPRVKMGRSNVLSHHSSVEGVTDLGDENRLSSGVVLGGPPQDIQLPGQDTRLTVGSGNVFREGVTINTGTPKENGVTTVGNRNLFMAGSHAGHDCIIEDNCILTNLVLLAGHVKVERGAVIGGAALFPPFTTVGRFSFVGGGSGVVRDVPPFMIAAGGYQVKVCGVNVVGLRRNGFDAAAITALQTACKKLYLNRAAKLESVLEELERDGPHTPEVGHLIAFTRASLAGRFLRAREVLRMKR